MTIDISVVIETGNLYQALEWCQDPNHPTHYGDAIRVAMHVFDQCKQHYKHDRIDENEVVMNLYKGLIDKTKNNDSFSA